MKWPRTEEEWTSICKQCYSSDSEDRQHSLLAPINTGHSYVCSCGHSFRRQGDLTRHKCVEEPFDDREISPDIHVTAVSCRLLDL